MKYLVLLFTLFTMNLSAQSLPIDFEGGITTADFEDFSGGTATVIPNPKMTAGNMSATVAQIIRNVGDVWAGSKIQMAENLDFTTDNTLKMKVFTTAPVGTVMKFKLEGEGVADERDATTTVSNEWQELTWDFTGANPDYKWVVFMFDFGNVGDGSQNSTFLFDDVEQLFGGEQIDLPVDFESSTVNYTTTDFGGNISTLTTDPEDSNNHVVQVIKPLGSATWAGTTIGTPAGFKTDIPLTLVDSKMTVKVWSIAAGTPIRLKVEDNTDPTHTCETQTNTTVNNGWETIEFDFGNQAPGTESLSVGLSMGWTYNMASIFFNFDTDGDTAGEQTYYFDKVQFGDISVFTADEKTLELNIYPNPSQSTWNFVLEAEVIEEVRITDLQGKLLSVSCPNSHNYKADCSVFNSGMYIATVVSKGRSASIQLIKN